MATQRTAISLQPLLRHVPRLFMLGVLLALPADTLLQKQPAIPSKTPVTAPATPEYQQKGEASWYGPGFHGKETASGETFDQNAMTAASPNLPLGSKAEVTDLKTGKKVEVQITDRGPYAKQRVIDLSRGAAKKLGIVKKGTAQVKIKAKSARKKGAGKKGKKPEKCRKPGRGLLSQTC